MGTMKVMDRRQGDFKISWDSDDDESVENAQQAFEDLKEKRFNLYLVTAKGKGEQIRDFDPSAEALLAVPQIAGGC